MLMLMPMPMSTLMPMLMLMPMLRCVQAPGIVPLFDTIMHHGLLKHRNLPNQFAYYIE